ncbi:hypothetical protein [Candidatus Harpocratesius sp.]
MNHQLFKKRTAELFINPDSKKIYLRWLSRSWMIAMIIQIIPLFLGKTITNNCVESIHSQIKRARNLKK